MAVKFSNNAATLLAANATTSDTTLTVSDGSVFPTLSGSDHTYVTLEDVNANREIVKVTARSGNNLTVVRAQDGTTARAFSAADKCELRVIAALLNDLNTDADTESVSKSGDTMTGNLKLSDGTEFQLGDSSEFKIKHHASGYTHLENTVGTLFIDSDSVTFRDDDGSPTNVLINQSGISVTGSVVADGLTVSGPSVVATINATSTNSGLQFTHGSTNSGVRDWSIRSNTEAFGDFVIRRESAYHSGIDTKSMAFASNGDISFYNDSAAQAFFFDSSTSRLGLGVTNPSSILTVDSGTTGASYSATGFNSSSQIKIDVASAQNNYAGIQFTHSGNTEGFIGLVRPSSTTAEADFVIQGYSSSASGYREKLRISDNGNASFSGAVTADGLTVDGTNGAYTIASNGNDFYYGRNGANYHIAGTTNGAFNFLTGASSANRLKIASNGDISFYDGSGNQGLFWDSSTSRLGLGTTAPAVDLDVRSNSVSNPAFISTGNSDGSEFVTLYGGTSVDQKSAIWWDSGQSELKFGTATSKVGASESIKMTIKSTGNVNIPNGKIKVSATTAPVAGVDIAGNSDTVPALKIGSGDTFGHFFYDSSATGDLVIKRGAGGAQSESMRLARATGAATFSGSVTADGLTVGSGLTVTNGSSVFNRTHSTTTASLQVLNLKATSSGDMANGFGPSIVFGAADTGTTSNQVAEINVVRAGSDTVFNLELQTADVTRLSVGASGSVFSGDVVASRLKTEGTEPTLFFNDTTTGHDDWKMYADWDQFQIQQYVNDTTWTSRLHFAANGNATFSGRTTSANSTVGSGTASTYVDLTVNGASTSNYGPMIELQSAGTAFGKISNVGRIQGGTSTDMFVTSASTNSLVLGTNNTPRVTIDASGNVGIGVSSTNVNGYKTLNVGAGTIGSIIKLDGVSSGHYHRILNNNGQLFIQADQGNTTGNSAIVFGVDAAERARLTSDGNLLVGKTSASYSTAGQEFRQGGATILGRSGAEPLILNRLTSDGGILSFRVNNTTAGLVGVKSDTSNPYIVIGKGSVGLQFASDTDAVSVLPARADNLSLTNGAMDIGSSTQRFRDLHLSGAIASGAITITSGQLELGANYRVRWGGSNNYSIMSDNNYYVQINADGEDGLRVSRTESTFNEGGIDRDFRVESDTKTHAFFVEGAGAAANQLRIGMGTGTITNPYAQTNFTDLNIDGVWGGVISFKLGGTEKGWIGQRNSGNGGMALGSSSGNSLYLNSGGNTSRMEFTSAGDVVVNPTGADNDFRVESDALTHALFVEGNTSNVYMGSSANIEGGRVQVTSAKTLVANIPYGMLGVNDNTAMAQGVGGAINFCGTYHTNGAITSLGSVEGYKTLSNNGNYDGTLVLKARAHGGNQIDKLRLNSTEAVFNEDGVDTDFRVESNNNANMLFVDAGNNSVNIGSSSNIGGMLNIAGSLKTMNSSNKVMSSLRPSGWGYSQGAYGVTIIGGDNDTGGTVSIGFDPSVNTNGGFSGYGQEMIFNKDISFYQSNAADDGWVRQIRMEKSTGVTINENGLDLDFRVESDAFSDALSVDGADGHTTIGSGRFSIGAGGARSQFISEVSAPSGTNITSIVSIGNANAMSSAAAAACTIYGSDNAGHSFMDVVHYVASQSAVVISSSTVAGSPKSRTYVVAGAVLRVIMGSGASGYRINTSAQVLQYPH